MPGCSAEANPQSAKQPIEMQDETLPATPEELASHSNKGKSPEVPGLVHPASPPVPSPGTPTSVATSAGGESALWLKGVNEGLQCSTGAISEMACLGVICFAHGHIFKL